MHLSLNLYKIFIKFSHGKLILQTSIIKENHYVKQNDGVLYIGHDMRAL